MHDLYAVSMWRGGDYRHLGFNSHGLDILMRIWRRAGVIDDAARKPCELTPGPDDFEDEEPGGEARDTPSPKPGTVGIYKIATNDHWLLNPDECRVLLGALPKKPVGDAHRLKLIERAGEFFAYCAEHGGCRVG